MNRIGYFRIIAIVLTFGLMLSAQTTRKPPTKKKSAAPKPATRAVEMPPPYREMVENSSQAMVVTVPNWNSVDGALIRYQKTDGKWQQVGEKVPVVVGKSGLGWDGIIEPTAAEGQPVKKEGDGRSPAGIFLLKQAFGFDPISPDTKMPYTPLTEYTECVDDASSNAYNQVVDLKQIPNPDWNSSEKMRTVEDYKIGLVVDYNSLNIPAAGSCIFMHIWKGPGHGTAGCTAMEEEKLKEIIGWIDPQKNPLLIQLPAPMYSAVKDSWQLP